MKRAEPSENVKKNLLDLQYNKYLQYYTTSIILLFTYFIGLGIAFITRQVDIHNTRQLLFVAVITIGVVAFIIVLLRNFRDHQQNILDEIRELRL